MSDASSIYDVRVVRFTKATIHNPLRNYTDRTGVYVCLGHFDLMGIDALDVGRLSPLVAIQRDVQNVGRAQRKDNIENYTYPLYMLKQCNAIEGGRDKTLNDFWREEKNYLIVTRFHCDRVKDKEDTVGEKNFSQILIDRCRKNLHGWLLQEDGEYLGMQIPVELGGELSKTRFEKVLVSFYDSLELGDIVGVAKSDSLLAILKLQRYLYECSAVSDAYTYCAVDAQLLAERPDKVQQERIARLNDYILKHATTRFSVKYAKGADAIYETLQEKVYGVPPRGNSGKKRFITGTADTIIEWSDCTEETLLNILRAITHCGDELHEAFQDIITRVGLEYQVPVDSRERAFKRQPFEEMVPNYVEGLQLLYRMQSSSVHQWSSPVIKLLSTLRAMYENSVMDDLSLLLIPGVNALLGRICHLGKKSDWSSEDDKDISEFLNCWASLTNDIFNLESQMTQHPELTPTRYYIPSMVLRFEQEFVKSYEKIIRKLDSEQGKSSRTFSPILFPSPEENVATKCFLDPQFDPDYHGDCPLCIFLPMHRLFQPWEVAHILAHEISHYSGDSLRLRGYRLECILKGSAAYLINILEACLDPEQGTAFTEEKMIFQQKLSEMMEQQLCSSKPKNLYYLRDIMHVLPSAMFRVISNEKIQEEYQDIIWGAQTAEKMIENLRRTCDFYKLDAGVVINDLFLDHIGRYILQMYKECYADILMILVLKCRFEDYYHCVYQEEYARLKDIPAGRSKNEFFERHTDRMALIMLVMDDRVSGWSLETLYSAMPGVADEWAASAWKKAVEWKNVCKDVNSPKFCWPRLYMGNGINRFTMLADEALCLQQYLTACAEEITNSLNCVSDPDLSELVALQSAVGCVKEDTFDWNSIRKFIESSKV